MDADLQARYGLDRSENPRTLSAPERRGKPLYDVVHGCKSPDSESQGGTAE
jgi:hypothetical protein